MEALAVPLRDLDRTSLPVAGGKAANLGELLRAGLPVPDGLCVTTTAYRRVVEAAGIEPRLSELLAGLNVEDTARLAEAGAAARELFHQAGMPEDVREALLVAARPLAGEPLAVRSSATAEDLPEASFAGQQDTYLNVAGEAALLEAVRRCWASLWTDRAIAYRQRNGIPHEGVALAVVVQRMVAAEVAGVMFTADPVSGKRTEIAIDASLGLGEAVVSGLVSPDNYVVDKRTQETVSRHIGPKAVQVVGVSGGGTTRVATGAAASDAQALSDDSIRALARLGAEIEAHYGWPQDVEWAEASGKLYILQSRPITSLYPAPPPAADGSLRVYVSISSMQGMLEPLTPMGGSLFTLGVRNVFYGGRPGPIYLIELGGRLYVDFTPVLRNRLGREVQSLAFPEVEPVIGRILARLLEDPRLAPTGTSPRRTVLGLVRRQRRNVFLLARRVAANVARPERALRRVDGVIVPQVASLRAQLQGPVPLGGEPEALRRLFRGGLKGLFFNLLPLVVAGIACLKQAEMRVHAWGLDEKLLARARQGLPHNTTTQMDLDLWALAQRLKADAPSREAVTSEAPSALAARYREGALPPVARDGLASFLSRYGHRGIREIDVGMPRWGEDPTYLFGVLRNYLAQEDPETAPDRHFARQAAVAERAVAELVAGARRLPGGWHRAPVLGSLLRRYRQLGGLRETPKFMIMWLFQAIRAMLLRTGAELVERGQLDRAEDLFFLRVEELERVIDAGTDLRSLVAQRRREYERELARRRAPRVITSEGEAFYGEALVMAEGMLGGTGASPGVARGRARVVHDPLGAQLQPGEILVAPSTDPAWTPLFLTVGGLVMEAGGMMSHGSIVAREYGIPAVVGVAEATTRIADGQMVEIDGHEGLVKLAMPYNFGQANAVIPDSAPERR
jgi:rifampicin phosphotransferase